MRVLLFIKKQPIGHKGNIFLFCDFLHMTCDFFEGGGEHDPDPFYFKHNSTKKFRHTLSEGT